MTEDNLKTYTVTLHREQVLTCQIMALTEEDARQAAERNTGWFKWKAQRDQQTDEVVSVVLVEEVPRTGGEEELA